MNQGEINWEWIPVDDGSKDPTGINWLLDQASRDARIRPEVLATNQGANAARNRGLSLCKADWAKFIDSDDWLGPNMLTTEYEAALKDNTNLIISNCKVILFENNIENLVREHKTFDFNNPLSSAILDGFGHPGAILYEVKRARAIGGWDESLSADQDGDFFARYISGGVCGVYNPHSYSCYREHLGERISTKVKPRSILSRIAAMCWIEQHYQGPDNKILLDKAKCLKWKKIGLLAFECNSEMFAKCTTKIGEYRHQSLFLLFRAMQICNILSIGQLRKIVYFLRVASRRSNPSS
ncbi:glycosyltransferase family 2 protein [Luteolibacter pohnpeiensis]|uniref:Glycosyltransferase family 2 protein n=1 Tax=Luteolibacter pohnpeiensis TaxID=454153 RepID=A0A934S7X2_9BACT|nr:glycosyltransferase family 2 protein [Luteolibacter pohnpeiensis]